MGKYYICDGAELECNYGSKRSKLVIHSEQSIKIENNLIAVKSDNVSMENILPFGKCSNLSNPKVAAATSANRGRLKEMPCVPSISSPWLNANKEVKVNGTDVLMESSRLRCDYGAVIEIKKPGQKIVVGG